MTRRPIRSTALRRRSGRVSEVLTRPAGVAAIALALVLGACAVAYEQSGDESGMPQEVPAGAIQVGDDYYMVPAGADAEGCERFRPWSASNPVKTAIYYRVADGTFSADKTQAACVTG